MRNKARNSAIFVLLEQEQIDRAFETPDGDVVWPVSHIQDVLDTVGKRGAAILGGDVCVLADGKLVAAFDGALGYFFTVWDTASKIPAESWTAYCERTLIESRSELSAFQALKELENEDYRRVAYIRPVLVFPDDPTLFVPRHKHDHERAAAAIAAGYPAVEPVLPELLEWLQDCNWPVAETLHPLLADIGLPLAPHLRPILSGDDEVWKYWIIVRLIDESRELATELAKELIRIASSPTELEKEEELDIEAGNVLTRYGLIPT